MSMEFRSNLGGLAQDIGTYIGIAEGVEQKAYVSGLLEGSYKRTTPHFVKAAAANAVPLNFTHMYEYNVRGITRGDGSQINPISQKARLWKDVLFGTGTRRTVTFAYRPATVKVPPHTTESTGGVAQATLDKLKVNQGKKYVFAHKAEVFEDGINVRVFPKQRDGTLFIPLEGSGISGNDRERRRGFAWRKSLFYSPGEEAGATGQFSFYFFKWWSSEGNAMMTKYMQERVTKDIRKAEIGVGTHKNMVSAKATDVPAEAAKSAMRVRKQFVVWAREEADRKVVII